MYLTNKELEAFRRGQASGMIPSDMPLPENEDEANDLIIEIGIMYAENVGCRMKNGGFCFRQIAVFSEAYLAEIVEHLPELDQDIAEVTNLRQPLFCSLLQNLRNYYSWGPGIINADDLSARCAGNQKILTVNEMQRGFEFDFQTEIPQNPATMEQRLALSAMVADEAIVPLSIPEWEQLTQSRAAERIRDAQQSKYPVRIKSLVHQYQKLTADEKAAFQKQITNQRRNA